MTRSIIHPWTAEEYPISIQKPEQMFDKELVELREEGKNLGKYLIGISNEPCEEMRFILGSIKDYGNYPRESSEVMIGAQI